MKNNINRFQKIMMISAIAILAAALTIVSAACSDKKNNPSASGTANASETAGNPSTSSGQPSGTEDATMPSDTEEPQSSESGTEPSASGSSTPSVSGETSGTPSDPAAIVEAIYKTIKPAFAVENMPVSLSDVDVVKFYTGLDSSDAIADICVSEPSMSAQAYSLVVVRVKDGVDAKSVADAMKKGIDPNKWVCLTADSVETASSGNYAILCMLDSAQTKGFTAKNVIDTFLALKEVH